MVKPTDTQCAHRPKHEKTPSWTSLDLSLQCLIFHRLRSRFKDESAVVDALGISETEFEDLQTKINLRRIHPADTDDIADYHLAIHTVVGYTVPSWLSQQCMNYAMFAGEYDYTTTAGLANAKDFLNSKKLDASMLDCVQEYNEPGRFDNTTLSRPKLSAVSKSARSGPPTQSVKATSSNTATLKQK